MRQQFQLLHSLNKYCSSCLLCFSVVVFLCSIYEETKSSYPCGAQETRAAHSHSMRGAVPRARLWLIQENREAALGDGDVIYTTNPGSVIIRILLHFVRTPLSSKGSAKLAPTACTQGPCSQRMPSRKESLHRSKGMFSQGRV